MASARFETPSLARMLPTWTYRCAADALMLGNLWIGQPFDQEREHLILTVSEINVRMGDRGWLDQRLDGFGGQPLRIMP